MSLSLEAPIEYDPYLLFRPVRVVGQTHTILDYQQVQWVRSRLHHHFPRHRNPNTWTRFKNACARWLPPRYQPIPKFQESIILTCQRIGFRSAQEALETLVRLEGKAVEDPLFMFYGFQHPVPSHLVWRYRALSAIVHSPRWVEPVVPVAEWRCIDHHIHRARVPLGVHDGDLSCHLLPSTANGRVLTSLGRFFGYHTVVIEFHVCTASIGQADHRVRYDHGTLCVSFKDSPIGGMIEKTMRPPEAVEFGVVLYPVSVYYAMAAETVQSLECKVTAALDAVLDRDTLSVVLSYVHHLVVHGAYL